MRFALRVALCLFVLSRVAAAEIGAETITNSTMSVPQPSWFIVNNAGNPYYIFDAEDGEMQAQIALSTYTPALQPNMQRSEFYAAESYYSRGVRGKRTDILAIYDMSTLAPVAEVELPHKFEPSFWQNHIGLLGNNRHVVVFNMTPGQSVSVVDIEERKFVGEIATPGCSTIMPVGDHSFLMICGDGALQRIQLDDSGREAARSRSDVFFSVENDPIGDKPVRSRDGWLFQSYNGLIYEATVVREQIRISTAWSLLNDDDAAAGWRIGSAQPMAYHKNLGLLFTLMHIGDIDARDDPATEVWVFDKHEQRRVLRRTLDTPTISVLVTQDNKPRLLLLDEDATVTVYDALQARPLRRITEAGPGAGRLQGF